MITAEMVRVYFRYDGDPDPIQRSGRKREREILAPEGWAALGRLRMALANLKGGQVADEAAERIRHDLVRQTDGPETAAMLLELA